MTAPNLDPPADAIAVGAEACPVSEDDSMVEDDDLNDIYANDEGDQPVRQSESAGGDASTSSAVSAAGNEMNADAVQGDDDYAKSFDSPNADIDADGEEEADAHVSEPLKPSSPTPVVSSAPALPQAGSILDRTKEPSPAASSDTSKLSSPLLSDSESAASPVAVPPAQSAPETSAPADDATGRDLLPEPQQQEQEEERPQAVSSAADADPSEAPNLTKTSPSDPSHPASNQASNDAGLAFDIQELVKDIRGTSSPEPSVSSGSSSDSELSGEMQIDGESSPAAGTVPKTKAKSVPPSASADATIEAPAIVKPDSAPPAHNALSLPLLPNNSSLPAPPSAPSHAPQTSRRANGGGRKGKNASQAPPNAPSAPANSRGPPSGPKGQGQNNGRQGNNSRAVGQTYDGFVNDERRYTAEAKWEKFPEGSRIFVGNLSQDRANKKEVFAIFHPYGRLAQISLKSAYGFVQYHTAAEAAEAIKHLQGFEVRGRKLNLEVSKTQKRNGKDRDRSPERNNERSKKRKSDSFDAREMGRSTDGYRPSYDQPRRGDRHGDDSRGRFGDRGRSRSRSPRPYSRNDDHRQRSPIRGSFGDGRGYGSEADRGHRATAPDAQIVLLQDVSREFVQYVQKAFTDMSLKTDVMFVDPRFMENVMQRLIVDGAHACVQLDLHAQNMGKVTMRVFKRIPGVSHVSYDEYRDLDANVAAGLVLQTKAMSVPAPSQPPTSSYAAATPAHAAPSGYPHAYAPPAASFGAPAPPLAPHQQASVMAAGLGQVDPAILQRVLMQLNGGQAQAPAYGAAPQAHNMPAGGAHAPAAPQIDINTILNNLRSAGANNVPVSAPGAGAYGASAYPGAPGPISPITGGPGSVPHNGGAVNPNQHVENIMAQLSRFRQ